MKAMILSLCATLVIIGSAFSHTAHAANIYIPNPLVAGYPLDLCAQWGANCGKPAADAYCKSKGYSKGAAAYTVKNDSPTTKVIDGGGLCVENYCDRISSVTCMSNSVVINNPTIAGYALDLCESWGANCGKPAADAFCKSKGYSGANSFLVSNDNPPTKVINGGGICVESYCDRISRVVCE